VFVLGWGYTKLIDVELSNRQLSSPSSSRELA